MCHCSGPIFPVATIILSDDDSNSVDKEEEEEDILAMHARERDRAAENVTAAVSGAIVLTLAKEVAREAMTLAASRQVRH